MRDVPPARPASSVPPDFDENGVDLAQVRAMLDLTPAERLARVTGFLSSLLAVRARNGEPGSD